MIQGEARGELGRIADYDLVELLGEGGMAAVYRGRRSGPGRAVKQVAVKVIHSRLSRERSFILMFLDEMRVAMALSHRNIVQTFDAGEFEGRHYLVMELVEGLSLQQLLRRLPDGELIPIDLVVFIGMEICRALDYAHDVALEDTGRKGVIHRDVCPSNILLSRHGDVKLTDFGVAKAAGRLTVSASHVIKGKLSYMAPEQARGEATRRSDLFSLGATLYEIVAGQPLRSSAELGEIFRGNEEFKLPQRPELSRALGALIASCISSDPFQRPANAGELRAALSDELFHLQQERSGEGADSTERLREFLARLLDPKSSGRTAAEEREADQLALAILEQARQVKPRTESRPEPTDSARTIKRVKRPARRRQVWIIAIIGLVVAMAVVLAWVLSEPPPPPPRETPVAPRSSPVATRLSEVDAGGEPAPVLDRPRERVKVRSRPRTKAPRRRRIARARRGKHRPKDPRQKRRAHNKPAQEKPAQNKPTQENPAPTPTGFGYLDLNASPWATVYIDGRQRGETPLQGLRLPAGSHHVKLVNSQLGKTHTLRVLISPGKTLKKVVLFR